MYILNVKIRKMFLRIYKEKCSGISHILTHQYTP